MSLRLYNTLTRQKELFESIEERAVKLYTCGPTVYNTAHIGNLRTYLFEDLLHRTLLFFGHRVDQVMNITDIDDKTLRGALNASVGLDDFTSPFKRQFFADLDALNIQPAKYYPEATAYIPQMIEMVEQLLKGNFAYKSSDQSIYFSIQSFPEYGRLAHLLPCSMRSGGSNRVNQDEYDKQELSDFALWKAFDSKRDGAIYWDSPWGRGRPGWHIECSAMARHFFGTTLDIHAGGVDNIFPHHENEIAQSQCANNQSFARYWLHAQHLRVEDSKMSKSSGNVYTLSDLLQRGFDPLAFRLLVLQNHYRTPINFTWNSLRAAAAALQRLQTLKKRLESNNVEAEYEISESALKSSESLMIRIKEGLADDLNSSAALAALFDWARMINGRLNEKSLGSGDVAHFLAHFEKLNRILGLFPQNRPFKAGQLAQIPDQIAQLANRRLRARQERDWARADQLRNEIELMGYLIEDRDSGFAIERKN